MTDERAAKKEKKKERWFLKWAVRLIGPIHRGARTGQFRLIYRPALEQCAPNRRCYGPIQFRPPSASYIYNRITVMTGPCQLSNGLFRRRVIITRLVGAAWPVGPRAHFSRPLMTEFLTRTLGYYAPLYPKKNTHLLLL